jgi:D-alanyl-D-alanine carboxypeptidase
MHGMLLPSGNDAAVAMATHLGTKLLRKKEEYDKANNKSHNSSVSES